MAILVGFFFMAIFLFLGDFVSAQVDTGLNFVANTGLGNTDPRIIVARIISIFLGFLGIIAVVLIIYAGFTWMTSEGDPTKLQNAKNILKNAIIGLIIILASFAITTFLLNMFTNSTPVGPGGGRRPPGFTGGSGAIGACIIESVYPVPGQVDVPRNTSIIVTFKEPMNTASIRDTGAGPDRIHADGRIKIYKKSEGPTFYLTDVNVYPSADSKTFVFVPDNYLGNSSANEYYFFYMSNSIQKADGTGAFSTCRTDYAQWDFEVSTRIDLDPPKVLDNGIFPATDDFADTQSGIPPSQAYGTTTVLANPNIYSPATIISAVKSAATMPNIAPGSEYIDPNSDKSGALTVTVQSDGLTGALTNGATLLGTAVFSGNAIIYSDLSFQIDDSPEAGDQWTISIAAKVDADTLTIGEIAYTFIGGTPSIPTQIERGLSAGITAANIAAVLSTHPTVELSYLNGLDVGIRASVAGADGNNIVLNSSTANISIIPMNGGSDGDSSVNINGKKDKPRNVVIQVNFNEAVNPLTISGDALDVYDTIRVVNYNAISQVNGTACTVNNDCRSFNCGAGSLCVDDFVAGSFEVSNIYKTVEFVSNDLCGVNGCGESIYCLPEDANIAVEILASPLEGCVNCIGKSPYNTCLGGHCYNSATSKNHPLSMLPLTSGVMDVSLNSFDGDRNENAEGSGGSSNFYNENSSSGIPDNFTWSFFTSDKIDLDPPAINGIVPIHDMSGVNLSDPVLMHFSKVMMSSSLKTGQSKTYNGKDYVVHKNLNLRAASNAGIGYWTSKENIDTTNPLDGEADLTDVLLNHTLFPDATSFRSQAGSGLKDIYQNCFKPVDVNYGGGVCIGTDANPSCCPVGSGVNPSSVPSGGDCP